MDYIKLPKNVKDLAAELKRLIDDYWRREITDDQLKEAIMYYAFNQGKKLFKGPEINPTIRTIIGAKRLEVLESKLEGFQGKKV